MKKGVFKGRNLVISANIFLTLGRDEKRLCEKSLEEAKLTGRYNLRQIPEIHALHAKKRRRYG